MPGLKDLAYEDRLKVLNVPSMSYRRIRGDLIEVYKFMQGIYNCKNPFEINASCTRGHQFKLKKNHCKTNLRQSFFTNRVIDTWNSLAADIVNATSLNSFKNHLDDTFKEYVYCASVNHPLVPTRSTVATPSKPLDKSSAD